MRASSPDMQHSTRRRCVSISSRCAMAGRLMEHCGLFARIYLYLMQVEPISSKLSCARSILVMSSPKVRLTQMRHGSSRGRRVQVASSEPSALSVRKARSIRGRGHTTRLSLIARVGASIGAILRTSFFLFTTTRFRRGRAMSRISCFVCLPMFLHQLRSKLRFDTASLIRRTCNTSTGTIA